MKLSFLIQLLFLLVVIIGAYLIFTNKVQGKNKLILIIVCLVLGVYLFFKLPFFKSHTEIITTPESGKVEKIIMNNELKKTDGPYGLSMWIFIDDWNYKYGEQKKLIDFSIEQLPTIYLDRYTNDLYFDIGDYKSELDMDGNGYRQLMIDEISGAGIDLSENIIDDYIINCHYDTNFIEISGSDISYDSISGDFNSLTRLDGTAELIYSVNGTDISKVLPSVNCPRNLEPNEIKIENISIQKWVNITMTINTRTLDLYLNGKLVKSHAFNNVIPPINQSNIHITPDRGFGGYKSKFNYYPYFITPKKAWSIYREGAADGLESALNKYNMAVSFSEDGIEKNKFSIF